MLRLLLLLTLFANMHFSCNAMLRRSAALPTEPDLEKRALVPVDKDCPICFDPLANESPIATPGCGSSERLHQFHLICLKEWTLQKEAANSDKCPECRTPLRPQYLPAPEADNEGDGCIGCLAFLFFYRFPE